MFSPHNAQLIIEDELKRRGIGKTAFLASLGLAKNYLNQMGSTKDIMVSKLLLFADALSLSMDFLLDRSDVKEIGGPTNALLLSKEEMKLVECFRESNERKQMQLLGWASKFAEEAEKGTGEDGESRFA